MIFRQFLNEPIAAASYLVGCAATGQAAIVDPSLPAETYALFAADKGLRVTHIFETHLHADYVSTGCALAQLTGAQIVVPASADVDFVHTPLADGEQIAVGNIVLRALHTPGHTPEHTAYVVSDQSRSEQPWFVFTGDCLFVGDVGRADLVDLPQSGPHYLYASLFNKLLLLADTIEVFPAHYGGSACGGKQMSGKVSSTIGFERRYNWALQAPNEATFTKWVGDTPRTAVEDVLRHRHTNQGRLPLPAWYDKPTDGALPDVTLLNVTDTFAALRDGAVMLDLRARNEFAAGHPAGAINVVYGRDTLAGRVAAVAAAGQPLVLFADQQIVVRVAADILSTLGRNPLWGALVGTPADWKAAGSDVAVLPTLDLAALREHVATGSAHVVDVREPYEWAKGVIDGASLISVGAIRERQHELPPDAPLVVVCESGVRATMVASLLRQQGRSQVAAVAPEGMSDYTRCYPTVAPTEAA